jgi:hypothetical protein
MKGEMNGRAKLKNEDVVEIREVYAIGTSTISGIARAYGVTRSLIKSIVLHRSWRHVQ